MEYIVTSSPTVMSGYVVRWFASLDDANHNRPILSASRDEVVEHSPERVTPAMRALADKVHEEVSTWYRHGSHAPRIWLRHVTHESPFFGDVRPVRYDYKGERAS